MHSILIGKDTGDVMFSYVHDTTDLNHPDNVLDTNGAPWQNILEDNSNVKIYSYFDKKKVNFCVKTFVKQIETDPDSPIHVQH